MATQQTSQNQKAVACDRLSATLSLDQPVSRVKAVSPTRATALKAMGIYTVRDLLFTFPRRYIDLTQTATIASAKIGESYTIHAVVHKVHVKRPKPRLPLAEVTLVDNTGTLIVTAFRQPWLADQLKQGSTVLVSGKVEFNYGFKRMVNPFIEALEGDNGLAESGRIIPVHPASEKVSAAWMRRFVSNALDQYDTLLDWMPISLRCNHGFMSLSRALRAIHFPVTMDEAKSARERLAYEEVLLLEIILMRHAAQRCAGRQPVQHVVDGLRMRALEDAIPFELTHDQLSAKNDILRKMSDNAFMNHLVLGDVGTGKTIVCSFALAAASDSGAQAVLMAPTEVLVQQHAKSLGSLMDEAGITWGLLTGSTSSEDRARLLECLKAGTVDVAIGTHALLEPDVEFANCSLAIIDEQQRFGVDQRAALLAKGSSCDALYLTATPIPRTLALCTYGDLSLSYLSTRPHAGSGRFTQVLRKQDRGIAYDALKEALARGEQAYVVCPLVGEPAPRKPESQANEEEVYEYASIAIEQDSDFDAFDTSAAIKQREYLQNTVFIDYKVGLLHGKMKPADKQEVMDDFKAGLIDVLVSTTVIEVGVDVPNATAMIIEDADRFGLSQLHQLRGRVGRGEKPGVVFLVSSSSSETAIKRLQAMENSDDGFELASYDLSLRREGDILGNRQHGASTLKLVNVVRDGKLIERAHSDAARILELDPQLCATEHAALGREASIRFKTEDAKLGG